MPNGPDVVLAEPRVSLDVLAEFRRARVVRRRWFFGVLAGIGILSVGLGWKAIRHFVASSWLESNRVGVSWEANRANWRQGGATAVRARGVGYTPPAIHHGGELNALAGLHHVEELDLSNFSLVNDHDVAVIESLTDLQILNLDQNHQPGWVSPTRGDLTDATLARLKGLSHLRELSVGGSRISDAGMVHLSTLPELRMLDLSRARISDLGLEPLRRLASLKVLVLTGTRVTAEGVRSFEAARPDVRVIIDTP